ncbi:NaeI family type II restriction endonuclease [Streptosporangium sp. NPDC005286]|uniref:NaeI family type II restriction endonuclease n=1 Tax=Streptosporangium sp. NPDC005286 TaxID=3154463 RepID=UPI0033A78A4D
MSVQDLCDRFTQEQFGKRRIPRHSTISQRLNGVDLHKDWTLIKAIIAVCTPPAKVEEVSKQAQALLQKWRTTPRAEPPVPLPDLDLVHVRQKVISLQNELVQMRALHGELAEELRQTRGLLASVLLTRSTDPLHVMGRGATLSKLDAPRDRGNDKPNPTVPARAPMAIDLPKRPRSFHDMETVSSGLLAMDPTGQRGARVLRRSFDQVLDGIHTGRYRWEQLMRSEKAIMEDLVTTRFSREFGLQDGASLDLQIDGAEFNCRYSTRNRGWMFSPDSIGQVHLLLWADDMKSRWGLGVIHLKPDFLSSGANRNGRRILNRQGLAEARWLHEDAPLPENVLLRLGSEDIDLIFAPDSGQKRVNELFRRAQGLLVSRNAVATVAMQEDYMKRVRGYGGARSILRSEGIVIIGGSFKKHTQVANILGLTVPEQGEFLSVRLARRRPHHGDAPSIELEGEQWVIATDDDPIEPAPLLPEVI